MRTLILAVAALATAAIAIPAATTQASAETIIVKRGGHRGGWHPHPHRKVIVVKRGHGRRW